MIPQIAEIVNRKHVALLSCALPFQGRIFLFISVKERDLHKRIYIITMHKLE